MSARTLKRENALLQTTNRVLVLTLKALAVRIRTVSAIQLKPLTLQELMVAFEALGLLRVGDSRFEEWLGKINGRLDELEAELNPSPVNCCVNEPVDEEVTQ